MTDYYPADDMQFGEVHDFHFIAIRTRRNGEQNIIYDVKKVSGGWVVTSRTTGEPLAARATLDDAKGYCKGARRWPY